MALVNREKNFIFIHIYRTGGTSIGKILGPKVLSTTQEYFGCHCCAEHVYDWFVKNGQEDFWNQAFKLTIVRNPYDWQISVYEYIRQSKGHRFHEEVKKLPFHQYLYWYEKMMTRGFLNGVGGNFYYTQTRALYRKEQLLVDFVGHFERLRQDFAVIADRIGVSSALPHVNMARRQNHRIYYRNPLTKRKIQTVFAEDFKNFGYELEYKERGR